MSGYNGNNENNNLITPVPFVGSKGFTLEELRQKELYERIIETKSLIAHAETEGAKKFYQEELDILHKKTSKTFLMKVNQKTDV